MAFYSKHILIMEITIKSFVLFGSVVLTGLSAGLFYAWSVSVIPGTQKVVDITYLQTMQSINRAILNPAFFTIFFGSVLFLVTSSVYEFHSNKVAFWFLVTSSITYLIGTIGVTGLGNVPLNNQLDALNLAEIGTDKVTEFRRYYESNWNRLHVIRTVFAVLSFMLATIGTFINSNH